MLLQINKNNSAISNETIEKINIIKYLEFIIDKDLKLN